MAIERKTVTMSKGEIRTFFVDFSDDLPEGVTVASVAVTHEPPSGTPGSFTGSLTGSVAAVQVSGLSVLGVHYVEVLATLSNGDKSSARLIIPVIY